MYRYETHLHTAESSACASASGEKQAMFYKSRGYRGIIVTDHFLNGNTTVPKNLGWRERVELFCAGYERARECGERIGLDVFFGWEYSFYGADLLTYGLDKEWLLRHPLLLEMDVNSYCEFVHAEGGMIVQAHPFREADYIPMIRLFPRVCTGCEVVNAHNSDRANEMAAIYAEKYGLRPLAGSDNHHDEQARFCGIETQERITDSAHLIRLIRAGEYEIFDEIENE
ncbi:MAG: hypothetical protein NC084_05475 [Bacteroides sp.]|nr:histidinol phosphatase [Eubacterium sp.]MCM1418030.1 histidinol phosphatase [Roseburia sp.]MCM1462147.1 hypothetical protein [Bacteroides sp.]